MVAIVMASLAGGTVGNEAPAGRFNGQSGHLCGTGQKIIIVPLWRTYLCKKRMAE
jgi:hypothetical protein